MTVYALSARAAAAEARYSATRVAKAAEGEYRPGPYGLPITGGWLSESAGRYANWWQMGHSVERPGGSAMVEACISAYAQTTAMCPGNHWRRSDAEGRIRVTNSALVRVLKKPNAYQSISDFLLNLVRQLMQGNAYALALRNDRFEISELHLMLRGAPRIAQTGEVFYELSGNPVVEQQLGADIIVPARDVLHVRLQTPRHPLIGESPLAAAAMQLAAGNAALSQQISFFLNQSRPSFVLRTDNNYNAEQVAELRARWEEQSAGFAQGRTAILTGGLQADKIGVTAQDAQLIEMLKLSDKAISNVYRVPSAIVGDGGDKTFASTEALMQFWLASGLGFVLNHVEEALGLFFKLGGQPDEYLEFDTSVLQRSALKERMEAAEIGVRSGILARNDARRDFELAPVDGGEEPWVQQQDVPLSVAAKLAKEPPAPPPPVPPAPVIPPEESGAAKAAAEADYLKQLREIVNA